MKNACLHACRPAVFKWAGAERGAGEVVWVAPSLLAPAVARAHALQATYLAFSDSEQRLIVHGRRTGMQQMLASPQVRGC